LSSVIKVDKIQSDTGTVNVASKIEFPVGTVSAPSIFPTGDTNTGIYFPAADTIAFAEGGAEAMRIDSSGNVGIGTSSPDYKTEIEGTGEVRLNIHSTSTTGAGRTAALRLQQDNTGGNDGAGKIEFTYGTTPTQAAAIQAISNPNYLAFYTSTTERMRIDSSGNLLVGTTSASAKVDIVQAANTVGLEVNATDASYSSSVIDLQASRNTTNASYYFFSASISGVQTKIRIADSGNVINVNGSYGTISDAKLKTDIVDAGSQWADIKAVKFRKFKMIDDPDQRVQLGVIAQEIEQVSAGLIEEHTDRDADDNDLGTTTKSVKTSVLLMKAAVALQEAMERIETLEAKNDALEARIAALEQA
jgi:hypothetical protein